MKAGIEKFSDYQLQDFLSDESFIDWVCSDKQSTNVWYRRLQESPELQSTADQAEKIIRKLNVYEFKEDSQRLAALKNSIDQRLDVLGIKDEFGRYDKLIEERKRPVGYMAVAACIVLLVTSFFIFPILEDKEVVDTPENLTELRKTRYGNKLTVHLSDGSTVKLNSGSQIRYQKYFSETERVIYLEGEAYFEVAKDSLRPFRVHTINTITQAIGTAFNVRTSEDSSTSVSLVEGKVEVRNIGLGETKLLTQGEMVISDNRGLGDVMKYGYRDVAWKDEVIIFNSASSDYVFSTLEKWYGVTFDLGQGFDEKWNYTGKFDNQSLRNVLTSIGHAENFEFIIQNKKVVIKPKKPQ